MPDCPVPGTSHDPIPEGGSDVETLENVINHLRYQDREYLEARCKQVLAALGVDVTLPTQDYAQDLTDSVSGGGSQ